MDRRTFERRRSSIRTATGSSWSSGPPVTPMACRPPTGRTERRVASEQGGGELVVMVGPPPAPAVVALAATGPVPQRDGVRVTRADAAPDGGFDAVDRIVHG